MEKRQILKFDILKIFHKYSSLEEMCRKWIALIKEYLDCEAVALRLKQDDDYPFFGMAVKENQVENELRKKEEKFKEHFEILRESVFGIIHAMSLTIQIRDPYTADHQWRVSDLVGVIAREMKLSKDQIDSVIMASTIHDIGKLSIPSEILSKPGKLNEVEFNLIKNHSQCGYDILKSMEFPWPIAKIVLQHHERMNGTGYPNSLQGNNIILEARILSIADVVEAMCFHRPYRPALGIDKALEEIKKNKGILYDSDIVDICVKIFIKKGFKFKEH